MITIGIELNHVVRNINKQLLKYYIKDYHPELDEDEIDENSDVLNDIIKFESQYDKSNFIYINYPYEIFGCAPLMDRNLGRDITKWQHDLSDREDNEYRIVLYSLYEDELTIQSSYFFLSKIGTRVREVFFPKDINEIFDKCDIIITSNQEVINHKDDGVKKVLINKNYNANLKTLCDLNYDTLTDIIQDTEFIDKLNTHE